MFSFLSNAKTVLLMGDRALHVYDVRSKSARFVERVPWDKDGLSEYVARIISDECGNSPVLVLFDMTEQYYKKDSMIKVSSVDKAAMLERKLRIHFPSHSTRGAVKLKEKVKMSSAAGGADSYILAAIADSQMLSDVILAIRISGARISGFGLLPAESSSFIGQITSTLSGDDAKSSKYGWNILITHHHDGGLRQIVTKNGDLALTRMTPISVNAGIEPETWSDEVCEEFKATIGYISRLGYRDSDSLRVVCVSPLSAGTMLEEKIKTNCMFSCISLEDSMRALKWNFKKGLGTQISEKDNEDSYSDVLHVIWAASNARLSMPMNSTEINAVAKPRNLFVVISLVLALLAIAQFGQIIFSYSGLSSVRSEINEKEDRKLQLGVQYQAEVKRNEALGIDVTLLKSSIEINDGIVSNQVELNKVLSAINKALGQGMNVNKLSVSKTKGFGKWGFKEDTRGARAQKEDVQWLFKLTFTFQGTADINKGNAKISSLRDEIQSELSGYDVKVTKFLKDYSFDKEVLVEDTAVTKGDIKQEFLAIIEISKDVK